VRSPSKSAAPVATEAATHRPLAIICGGGDFPMIAAHAADHAGRRPFLIGLVGSADARIETFPHLWLHLGEVGKFFEALGQRGIVDVAAVGAIKRPELSDLKFDFGALKRLPALTVLFAGGDNRLLAGVAKLLRKEGLKLVGIHEIAPQLAAPEGVLTRRSPSAEALRDARLGADLIAAISPFDVGQAIVVANGRVLAIEAAEGTDAMLARVADLRATGRLSRKGRSGVLVKAPKQGQEMRLDMPAAGLKTIEAAIHAEMEGVVLAAGRVLLIDREACIRAADEASLFIYGTKL
jgi:UDP-2,3-diacylglucosamine hydrolase